MQFSGSNYRSITSCTKFNLSSISIDLRHIYIMLKSVRARLRSCEVETDGITYHIHI